VYLYLLHSKDQKKYFTNRVRTFWESEDILAGPHFLRRLKITFLGLRPGFRVMVRIRLG